MIPALFSQIASGFKFDDPASVAGMIAIIGGIGAMIVTVINAFFQNRRIAENTRLTQENNVQGAEIKGLVNGTQTTLIAKLETSEKALNMAHGQIRAQQDIITTLSKQLRPLEPPVAVQVRSEVREPVVSMSDSTHESTA